MTVVDLAGRIRAFERELERRCATRIEETSFGTAFLNEDVPHRYDSNFIWVERPLGGVDADSLAADSDRVLGELGLPHRRIYVDDDEHGARLAPGFLELGWSGDHLVIMTQTREHERRRGADVRETGFTEARPLIEEVLRRRTDVGGRDELDELVGFRALLEERVGARFYLAYADGRPGSVCELYAFDGVAQIEDVNTLAEFRGRGLASAVVLAAADAARARACDVVFLIADNADWPKKLYDQLGFEPMSRFWSFLKAPK